MFNAIGRFLRDIFGMPRPTQAASAPVKGPGTDPGTAGAPPGLPAGAGAGEQGAQQAVAEIVPFDETLLERCRTMWQSGDWEGIKVLDRETLQHHPDRSKLALLAAAAHQQTGSMDDARTWLRLASEWGCSKQLISQIMISGVFNTLARASAAAGQAERAQLHFEQAMRCGAPKGNIAQLTQARIATQLPALGLESNTTTENAPG